MESILNTSLQDLTTFFTDNRLIITGILALTLFTSVYLKELFYKMK
ncbi:hypothetical protein [Flexithrix dorotheae]|nr:hypothetical protein [Flexithrix dorotheae]